MGNRQLNVLPVLPMTFQSGIRHFSILSSLGSKEFSHPCTLFLTRTRLATGLGTARSYVAVGKFTNAPPLPRASRPSQSRSLRPIFASSRFFLTSSSRLPTNPLPSSSRLRSSIPPPPPRILYGVRTRGIETISEKFSGESLCRPVVSVEGPHGVFDPVRTKAEILRTLGKTMGLDDSVPVTTSRRIRRPPKVGTERFLSLSPPQRDLQQGTGNLPKAGQTEPDSAVNAGRKLRIRWSEPLKVDTERAMD